jgi:hypothetical protein
MTTPANTTEVRDNSADRRFEIWADEELAGFTTYVFRSRSIRAWGAGPASPYEYTPEVLHAEADRPRSLRRQHT